MKSKVEKIKYNLRKVERAINGAELEQYLPNWEYDGDESYAAQKIIELVKCIIDISVSDFRTKEILSLRLGLADERPPLTLQQIGSLYGVTRERIRQIVNKGFRNLNNHLKRHPTVEQLALEKLSIEIFLIKMKLLSIK